MMLLNIFGLLNFSFIDFIDILLVAILIYLVFIWIRGSAAMNIFIAIIFLLLLRVIAASFNMELMSVVLGAFLDIGVLAVVIIFQPEIRHFLMKFGSRYAFRGKGGAFMNKLLGFKEQHLGNEAMNELAEACRTMSDTKTGALIVLQRNESLEYIIETGDEVDALVRRRLILNIFFKNSPLHDGAMVISGDRIVAARCTLPITNRTDIPASYGMRHKAAIGLTEETDADVVVVSEETGGVSFVRGGVLTHVDNINTLKLLLGESSDVHITDSTKDNINSAKGYTVPNDSNPKN